MPKLVKGHIDLSLYSSSEGGMWKEVKAFAVTKEMGISERSSSKPFWNMCHIEDS